MSQQSKSKEDVRNILIGKDSIRGLDRDQLKAIAGGARERHAKAE